MNNSKLAEILFPNIIMGPEYYEERFPPRDLPEGAKVTRLGPSPTGFIHLGNLYVAFVNERIARQSEGVFFLRIEDTDEKREVPGAVDAIISTLEHFLIHFDEGAASQGEAGDYGPYYQRRRKEIYQCFAKKLVEDNLAYPCFCSEEQIEGVRKNQEAEGENPGYYGKFATCRDLTLHDVETNILKGMPFVLRLRSFGDPNQSTEIHDGIRGLLSVPENFHDVVLLKRNGIPTYHFAHVVDDHLMRTTHVIRGEEWLSSLPIHIALFKALDWPLPEYCHTGVLMKMDGSNRRKLSKRKDPELSLDYYSSQGYHPRAVQEYLLTILNSNYEEWRHENPLLSSADFNFSLDKMSSSGTLFDLAKLNDVSKDVLITLDDKELYEFLLSWASKFDTELMKLFTSEKEMLLRILSMDRHGDKPRKDLVYCRQIFEYISYFFDDYFEIADPYPTEVSKEDLVSILKSYTGSYDCDDPRTVWFEKVRALATELGYAAKPKDYKKSPEIYKGHVGHISTVIRIALVGRASSPDLWEIQQIMGKDKVLSRIDSALIDLG